MKLRGGLVRVDWCATTSTRNVKRQQLMAAERKEIRAGQRKSPTMMDGVYSRCIKLTGKKGQKEAKPR
jgi:hypothetical protein